MTPTARRSAFGAMLGLSLALLLAPPSDVPGGAPAGTDKLVHAALFAGLGWTGLRAALLGRGPMLAALAGYGAVIEFVQGTIGRSRSLADWVADVAGLALAAWIARRQR